jgi:hypothetical protein
MRTVCHLTDMTDNTFWYLTTEAWYTHFGSSVPGSDLSDVFFLTRPQYHIMVV